MSSGDGKAAAGSKSPPPSSSSGGADGVSVNSKKPRKNPLSRLLKAVGGGGGSKSKTSVTSPSSTPEKTKIPISVAAAATSAADSQQQGSVPKGGLSKGSAVSQSTKAANINVKAKEGTSVDAGSLGGTTKMLHNESKIKGQKKSWLARTSFFQNILEWAFDEVDADGSGHVDEKELYSGLLLIHLKLGTYAGPAACKPISREKCHDVFTKMDVDQSGSLDREEFDAVMMVLFGNVLLRVLFQYACTLLIVPLIAQTILTGIVRGIKTSYQFVSSLDEHSLIADVVEVELEQVWEDVTTRLRDLMPEQVHKLGTFLWKYIDAVPSSVWNTIPLTLLSTILSLMIIPWSLMKIDDFFQSLADKAKKEKEQSGTLSQR